MFNFFKRKSKDKLPERIVKYVAPRSGKIVDCSIRNPTHQALQAYKDEQAKRVAV